MYYFNEENVSKEFNNAKDYCLYVASFIRNKYASISSKEICEIIEYLKENFKVNKFCNNNIQKEERLARLISEKQGSVEDLADFLILILYGGNIPVSKYSMLLANRNVVNGIDGSPTNPIKHFGICFKDSSLKKPGVLHIDLTVALERMSNIDICSTKELRALYVKDFYFCIIDKIYDIPASTIEEYYDKLILGCDQAKPRLCVG